MTAIEWTDVTWNPLTGCTRVSPGCDNCYAARQAATRLKDTRQYKGLATITESGRAAFNGEIRLLPERLEQPLHWRNPRMVFVNSMSDLFHELVPDEFIAQVFQVMARTPEHTYQILTKRPQRMSRWVNQCANGGGLGWITHDGTPPAKAYEGTGIAISPSDRWPLPNVWLGVSCEDQIAWNERVPILLETPAAVRWVSAEPLLDPIEPIVLDIDWLVVGGESGPGFRPMPDISWIRYLRDECQAAGVPFFFKQWGGRTPKAGGRELDGRTWDEYPRVAP